MEAVGVGVGVGVGGGELPLSQAIIENPITATMAAIPISLNKFFIQNSFFDSRHPLAEIV